LSSGTEVQPRMDTDGHGWTRMDTDSKRPERTESATLVAADVSPRILPE